MTLTTAQRRALDVARHAYTVVRAESSPYAHLMGKVLPSPVQPDPRLGSFPEVTVCGRKALRHPALRSDKTCNVCLTAVGVRGAA